jgi:hypothetical protein
MRTLRNIAMVVLMFFLGCVASASESGLVSNITFAAVCAIISGAIFAVADMIYDERR